MGKKFTIKSEDKAAFLNRLEKFGVVVDTFDIQDNKLDKTFTIEFNTPEAIKFVEKAISNSKGIDQTKTPKNVYTDKKANGGNALKEVENPKDVIKLDVPLFIRLLEYAREDAKTDMDLHDVAEKVIALSSKGQVLTMANYDSMMTDKIQEQFNPEDYEWEEEEDPKIVSVNSRMGKDSYVDCDVLTLSGEVKDLRFDLISDSIWEGYAECEAEDEDFTYKMGCMVGDWGSDGYRIVDIDKDSFEFFKK
jgi:hypothetical protein